MKIDLSGKNALVGGSTSGIGLAIAQQLAESGAKVTLLSRTEEKLQKVVSSLPTPTGQMHQYLAVDFSDFASFSERIKEFFEENTIDILVNNTQGPPAGGALEQSVDTYQNAFDLLFKSVALTTELALNHMMQQKWGRVITVSSISIKEPLNYLALSNSIRSAVVAWAKSLAYDVAPHGITVNNVLTGYFDTDRIAQLNATKAEKMGVEASEVRKTMEEQVPMKRIGDPVEFAYLATFLASEKSAYITGTNIPIDGGLLKSM
ncbi:MAG: SDR family oxidoreductase [Bacteroidota bacterium]